MRRLMPGVYDLLDHSVFLGSVSDPRGSPRRSCGRNELVVIDDPADPRAVNEVHRLIETQRTRFILTGSSARKLRHGSVNLLGGRARTRYLHPLTCTELGEHFDLVRAIQRGGIPSIYFSDDPRADLAAYTGAYLQQEIVAEAATRSVPAFSRFLRVAALCNATIVNFSKIASDAPGAPYHGLRVLRWRSPKDTLILHEVPAWRSSVKRKPLASSKYYFFDIGVASALQGRHAITPRTPEFGAAFESWIFHELIAHRDYQGGDEIRHWRSDSGFEVDFILGDHTAIEVKATDNVTDRDLRLAPSARGGEEASSATSVSAPNRDADRGWRGDPTVDRVPRRARRRLTRSSRAWSPALAHRGAAGEGPARLRERG
ncbi:MAG: DUF4143 domain-containing protein [Deltaproteobacteria bacterium]|nr:DUF4143 domain-containing protein [Deltaproteobacteria bacterium]